MVITVPVAAAVASPQKSSASATAHGRQFISLSCNLECAAVILMSTLPKMVSCLYLTTWKNPKPTHTPEIIARNVTRTTARRAESSRLEKRVQAYLKNPLSLFPRYCASLIFKWKYLVATALAASLEAPRTHPSTYKRARFRTSHLYSIQSHQLFRFGMQIFGTKRSYMKIHTVEQNGGWDPVLTNLNHFCVQKLYQNSQESVAIKQGSKSCLVELWG